MVIDISFQCSASHRWNIYLPIKKNIFTQNSSLKLVYLFPKDVTKLLPWNVTGAAWLRLMSRPLSVRGLSGTDDMALPFVSHVSPQMLLTT